MIQAHARWAVTAAWKSPGDGGDGKVASQQRERRDERLNRRKAGGRFGDQTHQRAQRDASIQSEAFSSLRVTFPLLLLKAEPSAAAERE